MIFRAISISRTLSQEDEAPTGMRLQEDDAASRMLFQEDAAPGWHWGALLALCHYRAEPDPLSPPEPIYTLAEKFVKAIAIRPSYRYFVRAEQLYAVHTDIKG